jgi:hypothetical protein
MIGDRRKSRMKRFAAIVLCLIPLGMPSRAASGVEQVSEASVSRLITTLELWADTIRNPSQSVSSDRREGEAGETMASRVALIDSIKEGSIDPLDWLKAHAESVIIPPLIEYGQECSRTASGVTMKPTALFTFGVEASEYGLSLISGEEGRAVDPNAGDLSETDAQKKVLAIVYAMRSFYRDANYPDFTNDAPLTWSAVSPDSSLRVTVYEANVYLPWGCDTLPTGPLLELSWNRSPDDPFHQNTAKPADDLISILDGMGMSGEEFLATVTALALARKDLADPSLLRLDDSGAPRSDEEEKLFAEVKRMVDIRRANMLLYEKYAPTLDMLLDLFEKQGK